MRALFVLFIIFIDILLSYDRPKSNLRVNILEYSEHLIVYSKFNH